MGTDHELHRLPATAGSVPSQTRRTVLSAPGDRIVRQVRGIDAWTAARRLYEAQLRSGTSRHDQEAASRHADLLRRTQDAITSRTTSELVGAVGPLDLSRPTAVVAHRHAWFAQKLTLLLGERGVAVVACTDNGADALGAVVADQPDLLLCGDRLAMMTGDDLLCEARRFAPSTLRGAQASDQRSAETLRATVDAVFLRHLTPAHVADALVTLVTAGVPERGTG